MTDNKKTPRSFQCRDALWERFEQMSRELECSVDYLINEAMKLYVRQREGGSVAARPGSGQHNAVTQQNAPTPAPRVPPSAPPPLPRPPSTAAKPPAFPAPPAAGSSGGGAQLPSAPMNLPGIPTGHLGGAGPAVPPLPPSRLPAPGAPRPPAAPSMAGGSPAMGISQVMPPVPRGPSRVAPPPPSRSAGPPQLSIYYGGERFVVNKDRFIIGRGRQTSDLTIKDPNVSRQHALVERVNGQYYIVDLGSTNGVEYAGQRVERRLISNGDVYRVCDHDLRFSFA
ncbi:MAG TPA: FHA domain-containing protein [Polyangiaceae bacterium]|nr:FHA domain-containing protein [Polyangiaceae bacterium]